MSCDANSASGTGYTLLTNPPSNGAASNRTAESALLPKSDSCGIKRFVSRKKLGVKRELKTTKKSEKSGRNNKFVPSARKMKIKIPVFSAAASMAGVSFRVSSTRDFPAKEMDDEGAL